MDEIYYVVGIDGRPWKVSPTIGAIIPLAAFFASVEAFRSTLNRDEPLGGGQRYFVIVFLVLLGMFLSKFFRKRWREQYTKRLLLNMIYLSLIATGFSDMVFYLANIQSGLQNQANTQTIWFVRVANSLIEKLNGPANFYVAFVAIICAFSLFYVGLQTWFHSRAETKRLASRPSAHIFRSFRFRERISLITVFIVYFVGTVFLISYLVIA
jgi:hypothetical protein